MEAPDKIYVKEFDEGISQMWSSIKATETTANVQHEYIHKDALLKYFHQRVEELSSPLNGVFGSTERDNCNERISELLLLIDKLNSL